MLELPTALMLTFLTFNVGDAVTSCVAFNRGGFYEANPMIPSNCLGVSVASGLSTAGVMYVGEKRIKTKWKKALWYGAFAAAEVYAVQHNIRELRK